MSLIDSGPGHKAAIREKVWRELRKVAFPDSRFHFDFSSFIADFEGSREATDRLAALPCFAACRMAFITPDNCLESLRETALRAGIRVLTTTYGIRRGFWLLEPAQIEPALYKYASMLDGMECVSRPVSLRDIVDMDLQIGLMVTGTGAINGEGIRFGKGHGFFDLEWSMLYAVGAVEAQTVSVAVVHDCQVLREELVPEEFDTVCDLIVTPNRVIQVQGAQKPTCGIMWDKLQPGMLENIPPLQELKGISALKG